MKILVLFVGLILSVASLFGGYRLAQGPLAGDPMQVHVYTLDNGLTVYLSENNESPTFRSEITVRAGSRDDPAEATGLAHYLEHLMFKGNAKCGTTNWALEKVHIDRITELYEQHYNETDPVKLEAIYQEINKESQLAAEYAIPNEFDKVLSSLGAEKLNAYTAADRTVYLEEMPANRLEQWAEIESNRFIDPVFRLFQPELEIVYEEKNRAMDNKGRLVGEAVSALLYGAHPYGSQTALGSIEHLKKPSLKTIRTFYDKHYVANNMAIALAGDFVAEEAIKVIDKHFSVWKSGPIPRFNRPMPEALTEKKRVEVTYPGEEYVLIAFMTQPIAHEDAEALKLVDMIMDNSAAGLINLNLNQKQRVLRAGSYPYLRNDAGAQHLYGIPKEGQSLEEVEALLLEQLEKVKRGDFEDWVIPAIVTDFKKTQKKSLETNEGRLRVITTAFGAYEDWEHVVNEIARMEALSKENVVAVANKYFGSEYVVGYRRDDDYTPPSVPKPSFDKIDIDRSRRSEFAAKVLEREAAAIEPRFVVEGRDFQIAEVGEGVRLLYSKNPVNDLFSLSKVFEMGSREMKDLDLAAALLDKAGVKNHSPGDLKRIWYTLGAEFNLSVAEHISVMSLSGLDENFDRSLGLFNELITAPQSSEDVLGKLKEIELKKRENRKKDHQTLFAALRNYNRHRENSPYLHEITAAEVKSASLEQLLDRVTSLSGYTHDYMYVGSLPIEVVVEKLRALSPGEKLKDAIPREVLRVRDPVENEVMYLDFETAQSQLRMEFPNGQYSEELASDISLFNEYFYGGMAGIVFQEMREARALAYSVWAYYLSSPFKEGDSLVMGNIGTQADKTVDATSAYLELWDGMPRTESRFEEATAALDSQLRVGKLGFREVLGNVRSWERQGLDGDPRAAQFEKIRSMSLDDLMAFYDENIKGRAKLISILGPSAKIDIASLEAFGKLEQVSVDDLFVD